MKTIVIYHANCTDGFGAAWAARKYFMAQGIEASYYPGVYNQPPPDTETLKDADVYLVDFSYPADVINTALADTARLTIIDHHDTAIRDIAAFLTTSLGEEYTAESVKNYSGFGFHTHMDNSKSGAMLTWEFFFPNEPAPNVIKHIQDRDLWKFELEGTREIIAALYSYPFDFEMWDTFIADGGAQLFTIGEHVLRAHNNLVTSALNIPPREMTIAGYGVPVLNVGPNLASDVGADLCIWEPFSATYFDTHNHRIFSLRSLKGENSVHVGDIAKTFGGGGHRNASGFRVAFADLAEKGLL